MATKSVKFVQMGSVIIMNEELVSPKYTPDNSETGNTSRKYRGRSEYARNNPKKILEKYLERFKLVSFWVTNLNAIQIGARKKGMSMCIAHMHCGY